MLHTTVVCIKTIRRVVYVTLTSPPPPPPNDAIILTETRSQITASMTSQVFLRSWVLVRPGFESTTSRSAGRCSPNSANWVTR